ncbi:hypothetical protein FRC01_008579, partial [Tulasnella sp. 417]
MEDNQVTNIFTIPPEIIIKIFEELLADNAPLRSPYADLLPVTQTSSRLRQTALSAPSLWSTIEISDKPSSFNFAKLCLGRSGNHKLDISIRVLKKIEIKIKGLLALLEYSSSRIRSLSMKLSFTNSEQWDMWWDSWKALRYEALEDFHLEVWRREVMTAANRALNNAIPLPDGASRLRSLALVHASPLPNSAVLSNLVVLKLASASFWSWPYRHLFDVLRSCSNLEELELRGVGLDTCQGSYSANNLPSVPRLELPNLRRLAFTGVENNMLAQVLTNLTAPTLEMVSLETPKQLKSDVQFIWDDLQKIEPFNSVRFLFVTERPTPISLHQDQFALFLAKLFPRIEEMELPASGCRPLLMTWAGHSNIALNSWKELRSLVLTYPDYTCTGSSQDVLRETLRFLEARRRSGGPELEWLHLGVCNNCQGTVKQTLLSAIKKLVRSKDDFEGFSPAGFGKQATPDKSAPRVSSVQMLRQPEEKQLGLQLDFKLVTVSLAELQITDNSRSSASFQALPPEILVGIFEYLLGDHPTNKSPYHFLLPVMQTSTHLRKIALAAPSLWSMIEINDKPASFNFAKVCLGRSGNHKLEISIRVLKKMESKIKGLLAMLQYASPRTRSLSLKLSFANPEQWDLWCESFQALDLGALESLEFEAWRREITAEAVPPPPNVIPLSDTILSLRTLSLGQVSVIPDPLVLSNLTRLELSSSSFWAWPYFQIFEVLQCCSALEELELEGVGLNTSHGLHPADRLPEVPRIELPNLLRLTFFSLENNIPPLIITNLTAPSLEMVSLETPKLLSNDIPFTWADPPT